MSGAPGVVRQSQTGRGTALNIGCHNDRQHTADPQQLRKARLHVEKAIQEKKIFTVQGPYPIIRRLLRARGWVERKLPRKDTQQKQQTGCQKKQQLEKRASGGGDELGEAVLNPRGGAQPSLGATAVHHPWPHNKGKGEDEDKEDDKEQCNEDSNDIHALMSFLVQDEVPNFLWTTRLSTIDPELLQKIEMVNRYPRVQALSTKEGLCQSLQKLSWFEQVDLNTFFPRCYRLGIMEEQEAFIEDFRLTAARSLLKLALEKLGDRPVGTEQPPESDKVPARPGSVLYSQLVEEALEVCEQHLGVLGHQDIDRNTPSPCRTCIAWDHFLQEYYRVAHEGAGLALSGEQRKQCQDLLQRLGEQLPQLGIEGNLNIWILKPSAKSRGRGIVCATRLEEVLQLARSRTGTPAGVCEWVVQKYVERPFTIFDTKFDIRQWFVVTDWKPLTVWFYRDCYLRFCSRPFSLRHLEPARHLCNVSIQKHYKTSPPDPRVPCDRIWSNKHFQEYLAQLGQADAWHRVMVPGMKAAILNALRCTRDKVGSRKGCFELFGADFLIGEDCQPWLLEVNSCPTMSPSSAVTRQLCANVQRDTLRLVLDRKDKPTCSIGAFELLYKEAAVTTCLPVGLNLMVEGCSLRKPQLAKPRSQDKPPITVPTSPQVPTPPGDRATNVPWSRAAWEKLPPPGPWSSSCLPRSAPPALPEPTDCSAGSQELPWLLHLVGQAEEAQPRDAQLQDVQPLIRSCSMDRVPGQPTLVSAGDQELPWLLHLVVGQPEKAQPQETQPQETQPHATLPPVTGCPPDMRPVPPPRGATRSPWGPLTSSAGSQELPWLLHIVGQRCRGCSASEDAQPQEAHSQEAQPKAILPAITCRPTDRLPPLQGVRRSPGQPQSCSAGSQGLPQLSQPGGQRQATQSHFVLPPIDAHPPVRGTMPPPRGVPGSPWRPLGRAAAPVGLAARPVRLPAL